MGDHLHHQGIRRGDSFLWFSLAKIVECDQFAEEFLNGSLFMNTLRFFRDLEDSAAGGLRGDALDGDYGVFDPKRIRMTVGGRDINGEEEEELVSIRIVPNQSLASVVLCLHSMDSRGFAGLRIDEDRTAALRIDERNFALGSKMVLIKKPGEFIRRVSVGLDGATRAGKLLSYTSGIVQYQDEGFHGAFPKDELAFVKRAQFSHQREYRVFAQPTGVEIEDPQPKPVRLEVGSLRDIAILTTPQEFNDRVSFSSG